MMLVAQALQNCIQEGTFYLREGTPSILFILWLAALGGCLKKGDEMSDLGVWGKDRSSETGRGIPQL